MSVLVALGALMCMASLFDVAGARVVPELRGGHRARDDSARITIASPRRVLRSIEDDFVIYEDTACDDDTIEDARTLGDWEGCRMWCSETSNCVAFDYNEKSSKCFLKGSWTKIAGEEGHISGVVKEQAETITALAVGLPASFQRMDDMECGGDEISDGILNDVESREKCEEACERWAGQGCRAYTWNKFNKRCFLKKDECIGESSDIGRFSGKITSPANSQQTVFGDSVDEPNFKRMDDTECGGDEIPGGMIKNVESRESCESACASRRGICKAYTWNSIRKRCYLKRDACVPESPDMGRFSGRIVEDAQEMELEVVEIADYDDLVVDIIEESSSCPETNPSASSDFDEVGGKVCDGNEFDVIDLKVCYASPTKENCGGECASNADCVSYSFDIYSKLCFFYSEDSCLTTSDNNLYESGLDFDSEDYSYGSDY